MRFNEESIWSGASLRPWQILHAKLAEMDMSGNFEVDVWQFVDEAMKSTTTASRLQEEDLYMPRKEELIWQQQHSAGWGSVMMEEEEEEQVISTTMASTSFYELFTATEAEEEEYENVDVGARTYNYHPYSANSAASLDTETPSNIIVGVEELQQALEGDVYAGAASSCSSCNIDIGDLEEEEILCAVCLETLLPNILLITRLPCGHSFHSPCIAPWLCASSLCPCCRAPFANALANYASPLPTMISSSPDLEAPPDLAAGGGGLLDPADHPCSDHDTQQQQQQQHVDLMDIFAEMETALNRFGLLFT